ncbi:phosphoglycolate phosphatase [Natronospirillum operosum]|uniref:phosphoglycolate phosphatase n=1 Tax=Natronospirillum operosum TaxID=2759953 RepID=A0A4Z0WAX6_9GAMM|nr:phosphoglycolate phosphatase [Natronospirillum operosum]TGG91561.1 phosphoglycolate phosphatase [Natronospirillum operosum]
MRLKAVLFDLDGTLVDSVPGLHQAVDQVLQARQGRTCTVDEVRRWVGNGPRVLMQRALGENSATEELSAALTEFEQAYARTVFNGQLYPGVTEGLTRLRAAGLHLACLTNKPWPFTLPILHHLDIADCFATVICGDQIHKPKPHPESLTLACERLEVSIEEAMMVGDSVNDLAPAQELNMPRVAVTYGYHQGEDLTRFRPDLLADDFTAVVSFALQRQHQ